MAKKEKKLYVTFFVREEFCNKKRLAVECNNMAEVNNVAYDCNSLAYTGNIRLRKCGKPSNRKILSVKDYFNYKIWL